MCQGKPDIVLRPYRTAIFVNGCFWHGHGVRIEAAQVQNSSFKVENSKFKVQYSKFIIENSDCCKIPQSNREFWISKIRRNQERDERNYRTLRENGWQVIVVWECQLKADKIEHTMREVEVLINDNLLSQYKHKVVPFHTEEDERLPMAAEDGTL